jgi:hypothetical protein
VPGCEFNHIRATPLQQLETKWRYQHDQGGKCTFEILDVTTSNRVTGAEKKWRMAVFDVQSLEEWRWKSVKNLA